MRIAVVLLLVAAPAHAAHIDISGFCYQQNMMGGVDDGTCASVGMKEGERFKAFIDIDPKGFSPRGEFRISDAVSDWRIDWGGESFTPKNTSIGPEIGENGGTWWDTPNRFMADIDIGGSSWQTYLFLTNHNGKVEGQMTVDDGNGRGAILKVEPVPLPAAGWLLLAGVGALTAIRRSRCWYTPY
jgi:hypothetical protein